MKNLNKLNYNHDNSWNNYDIQNTSTIEQEETLERSNLGGKPQLELFYNGAKHGFFSRQSFDPQVTPGETSNSLVIEAIRDAYKKSPANTILSGQATEYKEKFGEDKFNSWMERGSQSLQNSRERDTPKQIANFAAKLCLSDRNLMELSEIDSADAFKKLSPRQAMLLSTNVVMHLKKYDHSEVSNRHGKADKMSTLEIMKSLLKNPDSSLGVCRNYADMTRAIFNSLKALQDPETTRLANTYCREIVGEDPLSIVNPENPKSFTNHKYNQFITITQEGVAITNVDPTWSKIDKKLSPYLSLATNIIEREPLINGFVQDLWDKGIFMSPEDKENTLNMREYYVDIAKKTEKLLDRISEKGYNRENHDGFKKVQNMQYYSLLKSYELSEMLYQNGHSSDNEIAKYRNVKIYIDNQVKKLKEKSQ